MAYEKQNFIPGQKLKASELNHMEEGIVNAVSVTEQTLSEEQKAQARENIGITGSSGGSGIHIGAEAPEDKRVEVWIDTAEDGILFYVNISAEDGYACTTQVSTLEEALDAGGLVVAKITTDAGALFAQLCSYETSADNTYGRIVMFALGALTFTLTPTANGYKVAVSGD